MKKHTSFLILLSALFTLPVLDSCTWDPEDIMGRYFTESKGIVLCDHVCAVDMEDYSRDCNIASCHSKCEKESQNLGITEDQCKEYCSNSIKYHIIDETCTSLDPDIKTEDIKTKEECEQVGGDWQPVHQCSISNDSICALYNGSWNPQSILDLGNARYLRFFGKENEIEKANLYRCGNYDAVVSAQSEDLNAEGLEVCKQTEIDKYIDQRKRHFCPKDAQFCVSAYRGKAVLSSELGPNVQLMNAAMCSSCDYGQALCETTDHEGTTKLNVCVDLLNNPQHCGSCSNICKSDQFCHSGICTTKSGCEGGGLKLCTTNGVEECVDTKSSTQHCGDCNQPCIDGQICSEDSCVCPGEWTLNEDGDKCVNRKVDIHCCGGKEKTKCNQCIEGQLCLDGFCECQEGWTLNDKEDKCVNRKQDNTCCGGSSGENCEACTLDQTCQNGSCQCADGYEAITKDGTTRCVDKKIDPTCCGTACLTCADKKVCNAGRCECPSGLEPNLDDSKCVDRNSDATCCGEKCETCKEPYCSEGKCSEKCVEGQILCASKCLDANVYHVKEAGQQGVCMCDNYCDDDNDLSNGCNGLSYDKLKDYYQTDCDTCMEDTEKCEYSIGEVNKTRCVNLKAMHMKSCNECEDNWLTANYTDKVNLDISPEGCTIDLKTDINNCGKPYYQCSANMYAIFSGNIKCVDGVCDYSGTCEDQVKSDPQSEEKTDNGQPISSHGDCDNNRSNGCETEFREGNTAYCGSCTNTCKIGQVCKKENDASNELRCCFGDGSGCSGEACLKKGECCAGLELYRKCFFICIDTYMCSSSSPSGSWRIIN